MDVIDTKNLNKQYKDISALSDINVSITENKIIGLIGKNGAGKTTFLKTCAGRIKPTSGDIKIFNETVFDNLDVLSKLVFVDEESNYSATYKIKEIMNIASLYYDSWNADLAKKLIKHFNLNIEKKYKTLSRGMKTQVNVIIGICCRMPLTILDEPTLGLDAAFRKDLYHILLSDFINNPRTIIISSHLLNELDMLLEEIILIDDGRLIMHKTMDEFKEYSIMLNGDTSFLESYTKDKEIINVNNFIHSSEYVIRNSLTNIDIEVLNKNNITVSNVSPQDLFIYLTSKGMMFDEV